MTSDSEAQVKKQKKYLLPRQLKKTPPKIILLLPGITT